MEIKKFGFFFLLGIIIALAIKFYLILAVFLPSIATAFVLAYLANPFYIIFLRVLRKKSLSAFAVIILLFVLILIPSTMVILSIQPQVMALFSQETIISIQKILVSFQDFFYRQFDITLSIPDFYNRFIPMLQNVVTSHGPKLIVSITGFTLSAFLTFFIMYYILVNSGRVIEAFKNYFPLSDENVHLLLHQMASETRTLILGQFLVALIQGTLGGIGFLIFGISGALLWGFIMTFLAFIPFLGTFIVWFPAGIIMLSKGDYFSGFGIIAWGLFLVSIIDNIIRPKLTSTLGSIHPVVVLLGVLIGINEWGFIGVVLGPLLISILLILIRMFREEYISECKE